MQDAQLSGGRSYSLYRFLFSVMSAPVHVGCRSAVAAGRSPRMSHGAADLSSPTAAGYDEISRFAAQQNGAPRLQLQMQDVHAWQQPLAGAAASDVRRATFTRSPEGYVGGSSADGQ